MILQRPRESESLKQRIEVVEVEEGAEGEEVGEGAEDLQGVGVVGVSRAGCLLKIVDDIFTLTFSVIFSSTLDLYNSIKAAKPK